MNSRGLVSGVLVVAIIWGLWLWLGLGFSFAFLAISVLLLAAFLHFEQTSPTSEATVLIASLAAMAAASRIPFAVLPSVQPVTFLVLLTGLVFGRSYGFIVGAVAAFVSNLILGQGPWTPWQMLAWGSLGWLAGVGAPLLRDKKTLLLTVGFLSGFFFGWFMNIWVALAAGMEVFFASWVAACIASFPMDLAHALSTVLFLYFFSAPVTEIFLRLLQKYKVR